MLFRSDTTLKLVKIREHRYKWIIEDGDVDTTPCQMPYHKKKGKKIPKNVLGSTTKQPGEDDGYVSKLELAVRTAVADAFGLDNPHPTDEPVNEMVAVPPSPTPVTPTFEPDNIVRPFGSRAEANSWINF